MDIFSGIVSGFPIMGWLFIHFWWIIMPPILYFIFFPLWMDFVNDAWAGSLKWVLLEVVPPKDIERSPKIMESFFSGIAGVVVDIEPFGMYLKGAFTDQFSLELVGDEGSVHFYIRTQKKFRNLIEAQIYAQYPDATIIEVSDYVNHFPKVIPNKDWDLWGSDLQLVMPDPYPIRTYDKFEETVTGTIIDPLAAMVEVLGRLGPGQHIWMQCIIQPLMEKWRKDEMELVEKLAGRLDKKEDKSVLNDAKDVVGNLFKGMNGPVEFPKATKKEQQPVEFRLTPGEKEVLKAVEENLGKNAFKTKIRLVILGRREVFDKSFVTSFFGAIKQFNDLNLNSFKPHTNSKTYAHYVFKKSRLAYRQRKIYDRYKKRSMDGLKMVLSTRELATIYHFPDMGVKAPNFSRVESKRGSAPANLPIE